MWACALVVEMYGQALRYRIIVVREGWSVVFVFTATVAKVYHDNICTCTFLASRRLSCSAIV